LLRGDKARGEQDQTAANTKKTTRKMSHVCPFLSQVVWVKTIQQARKYIGYNKSTRWLSHKAWLGARIWSRFHLAVMRTGMV
jgi:hypothetical protein